MKWQKNTGVMPCEGDRYVKVKHRDGRYSGPIRACSCMWYDDGAVHRITHYCILEVPPFDYEEPKVWQLRGVRCKVGGVISHEIECSDGGIITVNNAKSKQVGRIIDALNAMEESK